MSELFMLMSIMYFIYSISYLKFLYSSNNINRDYYFYSIQALNNIFFLKIIKTKLFFLQAQYVNQN